MGESQGDINDIGKWPLRMSSYLTWLTYGNDMIRDNRVSVPYGFNHSWRGPAGESGR